MDTVFKSPNFYEGRLKNVRLIVVHTIESGEGLTTAEDVARNWFGKRSAGVSAHVNIDPDSECRVVDDEDTAWAAAGANSDALHAELAGRAAQSSVEWDDIASRSILERFCQRAAIWCRKYSIPVRHLTVDQVRDGKTKGICGHWDVTLAFPTIAARFGSHSDPGKFFPWVWVISRINAILGTPGKAPAPTPPPARKPITAPVKRLQVDGIQGPKTISALQWWAGMRGSAVDGIWGQATSRALQRALKVKDDGVFGPISKKALQTKVGAHPDGDLGPKSWKAIQTFLNR